LNGLLSSLAFAGVNVIYWPHSTALPTCPGQLKYLYWSTMYSYAVYWTLQAVPTWQLYAEVLLSLLSPPTRVQPNNTHTDMS